MKRPALHWQVIIGLLLGTGYAFLAVKYDWADFTLDYINPFGDIFISVLKMVAVPLVLFSIISGIVSMKDVGKLGRIGVKTLLMYLVTTMFAVTLGLVLVNVFTPGTHSSDEIKTENRIAYELWRDANSIQKLDEMNLSKDPANTALVEKVSKRLEGEIPNDWVQDKLAKANKERDSRPLQPLVDVVPSNIFKSLADSSMLQVIFFAILFGIVIILIPAEKAEPVVKVVDGLNEIFVKMIMLIMKAMPIFVFALMAGQIVKAAGSDPGKFMELLGFLLRYGLVVVLGLLLMIFLVYPLVARLLGKMKYGKFTGGIRDAQFTAFATSSSVATLPVTIRCVEDKIGVSKPITSFVLPIGATVNMDGTSLYQAVAVVALAQFHMVDLSIAQQLTIVLTATLASIGAAAVPSAGLVLMIIVLSSVGLNEAWIALIFPIDRILDMCRTVVNVTGDSTVATVIAKSEGQLNPPEAVSE